MQQLDLHLQFLDATKRGDWPAILELGAKLHERGDYGNPAGQYAYWMEIAAGSLGRVDQAVDYSDHGLKIVTRGTLLEADLLCNGMYSSRLHVAPERVMELGARYFQNYDAYPADGKANRPRVLYCMAGAQEDGGNFDAAHTYYRRALDEARELGQPDLAGMIAVDLAFIMLRLSGSAATPEAAVLLSTVNESTLTPRGRFALIAGQAELEHASGNYVESNSCINRAMGAAGDCGETLQRERAHLTFLRAKNEGGLGHLSPATILVLEAAQMYKSLNDRLGLASCMAFLQNLPE